MNYIFCVMHPFLFIPLFHKKKHILCLHIWYLCTWKVLAGIANQSDRSEALAWSAQPWFFLEADPVLAQLHIWARMRCASTRTAWSTERCRWVARGILAVRERLSWLVHGILCGMTYRLSQSPSMLKDSDCANRKLVTLRVCASQIWIYLNLVVKTCQAKR